MSQAAAITRTGKVAGARDWLGRYLAELLLMITVAGLLAGGLAALAGAGAVRDGAWFAVGCCGAAYALWAMIDSLRRRRLGVDAIALLAVGVRWPSGSCWPRR